MSNVVEVKVPDIGDFDTVEIIEVLVSSGDQIAVEDSLIILESDKASMEIPAPQAGIVQELLVQVGDKVAQGSSILTLEAKLVTTADNASASEPDRSAKQHPQRLVVETVPTTVQHQSAAQLPSPTEHIDTVDFRKAHASPAVRRFARELGVDLTQIEGTGRKKRIVKTDVKDFVKHKLSLPSGGVNTTAIAEIDFSQWGEVSVKPLTKINKLTGQILHRSWANVPHVTQYDEADITDLESFRKLMVDEHKHQGIKITILSFLVKAVVSALQQYPRFNASLDITGDNLILKSYCNIGIAIDTPDGLVVPVIHEADGKSLIELASELQDISAKARNKKLRPVDMQGGCFSISSLGGIGGTMFAPIVNVPEVAILGVSRGKMQPIWNGKEFVPKLILPLSLSYDHRVIDGADGARFTGFLNKVLSDTRRLLL